MPFTFKQFHVDDQHCGMPVSTDSVLLGAWAWLPNSGAVLDIGTGSGLLALMAAQRCLANITAVEIEPLAQEQAKGNFGNSPWSERLSLVSAAIQDWQPETDQGFDAIVCNPPYFQTGPRADGVRGTARHGDTLSLEELLAAFNQHLKTEGQASLILPTELGDALISKATEVRLHLQRLCTVSTVENKAPSRWLMTLGFTPTCEPQSHITIRDVDGQYTNEFKQLTQDFYLKMGSSTL